MHVGTGAIAFSPFIRHIHPCDRTAVSYTDYLFELRFGTEVEETYDEKWGLRHPDSYT
jgi:hypothetical protein